MTKYVDLESKNGILALLRFSVVSILAAAAFSIFVIFIIARTSGSADEAFEKGKIYDALITDKVSSSTASSDITIFNYYIKVTVPRLENKELLLPVSEASFSSSVMLMKGGKVKIADYQDRFWVNDEQGGEIYASWPFLLSGFFIVVILIVFIRKTKKWGWPKSSP